MAKVEIEVDVKDNTGEKLRALEKALDALDKAARAVKAYADIPKRVTHYVSDTAAALEEMFLALASLYSRTMPLIKEIYPEIVEFIKLFKDAMENVLYEQIPQKEVDLGVFEESLSKFKEILGEIDAYIMNMSTTKISLDVAPAIESLRKLQAEADALDLNKTLFVEVSEANANIRSVKAWLDSIPDVTVKTLLIKTVMQASPVRPFTEGADYVERRLRELPRESSFRVKVTQAVAGELSPSALGTPLGSVTAASARYSQGVVNNVTFSPSINVSAAGGTGAGASSSSSSGVTLARQVDRALADLWSTNRSALRRAMTHA